MKKRIFLSAFFVGCLLAFSGCGQKLMIVQPTFESMAKPTLNTVITKNIGEDIIIKGTFAIVNSLELLSNTSKDEAHAGIYSFYGNTAKNKVVSDIYKPVASTGAFIQPYRINLPSGSYIIQEPDIALFRDVKTGDIRIGAAGTLEAGFIFKAPIAKSSDYNLGTYIIPNPKDSKQSLVYTGKQDDTIKFLYQEFKEDMNKPIISVEVAYNLKDSNEFIFKTAKFKIINATSQSITYILIKNFD